MKKNSLTNFKKGGVPILPQSDHEGRQTDGLPRKSGPKPKPASEKRSHRVLLSLTPLEAAKLKERAGLAGEATIILAFLKEHKFFE